MPPMTILNRPILSRRVMRAMLLATVAAGLAACSTDSHLEPSASAAVRAGAEATGEAPGSPASTLLRVARSTRDHGDYASAVTVYKRVHELSPMRADILVELGQVLSALGAHNEAAEVYRDALKLDAKNVDGLRGLGNSLLAMNQPELALEQFVAGLALQNDPRLFNGMGVVHDMNGSYESAQESYRRGLDLAPSDANLRNNLALSLAISGKYDEAIQILSRLANETRSIPRHRQNLALVYGLSGKFAEAASVARLDFDEPTVQNNLAYYETLRAMSQQQRAAAVFGITVTPSSAPALQQPAQATPAATAAASEAN
jgi:Flp pilus assembly protein TadD